MKEKDNYVHALRFKWLNKFYDLIISLTMRESLFRGKMVRIVAENNISNLLDIACGTGSFLNMLKKDIPQISLTGLDGDPGILKFAKQKATLSKLEIDFREGFSTSLPFAEEYFNAISTSLFLHHLEREDKLISLKEMHRVLKDEGLLLICDWDKPSSLLTSFGFYFLQFLDGFKTTKDHRKGLISKYIKESGFRIESKESLNTVFGSLSIWKARKTENE